MRARLLAKQSPEDRLRQAFHKAEVLPDKSRHLEIAISRLATIAAKSGSPGPDHPFKDVGRRRTADELAAVAAAADKDDEEALRDALKALHAPAIKALARYGVTRGSAPQCANLAALVRKAVAALPSAPDPAGGRPRDNLARVVAAVVIGDFEQLTGEKAWRPDVKHLAKL